MFEAHVLHLLRRYLGEYVHGLSLEALRISVWKGDVVLKDLKLKSEALNSLKLPVTVKAGFVGTITLKVPWKCLGKEPVIVLVDRVFVLAHPASDGRTLKEEDRRKLFEAKLQQIEEAESATLEAMSRSKLGMPSSGSSWLSSLIATIIGNLKISITNVHVRYEDWLSNPGHPFSCGATLAKLAAVTMDELGNETFDTSGALDRLRKSLELNRFAVYHDSNSPPWKLHKRWEDLTPKDWIEIFEDGINNPALLAKWALDRNYLVSPINATLKYHRLGKLERNDPDVPFEKLSLFLNDNISLTVSEVQYHDWMKLLEVVSRYKTYMEVSHLRPQLSVSEAPAMWWGYAAEAVLHQKKTCFHLSWDRIQRICQLRRRYVQLYAHFLQHSSDFDASELRVMEKDLDFKIILLWRLLAHAKVESVKKKEAAEQRRLNMKSWFSFTWRTSSEDALTEADTEGSPLIEGRLTKEEWQAISDLLSHQMDEDPVPSTSRDTQSMIHFLVSVYVKEASARIIDTKQTEVVCGQFEQLHVSTKFKSRSTHYEVLLKSCGLSAPEGSIAKSVSNMKKTDALHATFVLSPDREKLDWRLCATISPCHIKILMKSFDRFFEFLMRSKAVSPIVASETANALQNKIEKVTRRAQEKFQYVFEEQSRFSLDIDLDAPKVIVPMRTTSPSKCDMHFLLDFGHFTLHTVDCHAMEQFQRSSIYSRFSICGRDLAAFFSNCDCNFQNCPIVPIVSGQPVASPVSENENFYSLIDKCGMTVIIDWIKGTYGDLPSTCVSIQVPNLGIHFSPTRYYKLLELSNILYSAMDSCGQSTIDDFQARPASWSSSDIVTNARILVWGGIGNCVATWKPCCLVLSGRYLYIVESLESQTYQRYLSMAGRQVIDVPPSCLGGSPCCIAVSYRLMDLQQALESTSTWVLGFEDHVEKTTWLRGLVQATYRASVPLSLDVLAGTSDAAPEIEDIHMGNLRTAGLVIKGTLSETKLSVYGKIDINNKETLEEKLIIEVLASGGKVHVISSEDDMIMRLKLHSLTIKDKLQGCSSSNCEHLVRSIVHHDKWASQHESFGPQEQELSLLPPSDDDEVFKDALPDFFYPADFRSSPKSVATKEDTFCSPELSPSEVLLLEHDFLHRNCSNVFFEETAGCDSFDFVSVTFSTKISDSPDYDDIDTQMNIRMSELAFYCNRPTLVALIDFGFDLSNITSKFTGHVANFSNSDSLTSKTNTDNQRVKGLLGFGKSRVVFYFILNVDKVTMLINMEDGSQLASIVQESFLLDLKVYPSSFTIEGTLGNFRLCDLSLASDNNWHWLCDLRFPGCESIIKFKFSSYSAEDDDYEGYGYSLSGRLSAVRVVFLYRFVQEITVYFTELITPNDEAVKLVDKVGGFEWLIQKNEIDGAIALKLDLVLDKPMIVVPKNSLSRDCILLDLGNLHITNEFRWHGVPEIDPSAVHMDVLHAEIQGINMSAGVDGCLGKPMVREGQKLDVYVRRSLRDIFRKVPSYFVELKVGFLHCIMSDKEYNVILDCATLNLREDPSLPPSFRGCMSTRAKDTVSLLVDKINLNRQTLFSHTVSIVEVEVNHALLELCNGVHESPLAHLGLDGLWVSYRMSSLSETDLYVTILNVSVMDMRQDTKSEMRLMLGPSSDAGKQFCTVNFARFGSKENPGPANVEFLNDFDGPIVTMFLMDCRWRDSFESHVVRIQQPRILVVPDFLITVGQFFVPVLRTMTGKDDLMDSNKDPITGSNCIILQEPLYRQYERIVHLSPSRQLIADAKGVDDYTYDGCGNTISLNEGAGVKNFNSLGSQPIIIVGRGKSLRFVNVKIENSSLLRRYTYLSNDSRCSISMKDGVDIMFDSSTDYEKWMPDGMHKPWSPSSTSFSQSDEITLKSLTFEAQVISPELTFYDSSKSFLMGSSYDEKLLRAKTDVNFMYASREDDVWIKVLMKDFYLEAGSGLMVLDPVDISGGYSSVKAKTNLSLVSTDMCFHLSLSCLSLLLNLQNQASTAFQFGNALPVIPCTNFSQVWPPPKGCHIFPDGSHSNGLTFWRPLPPADYVVLGDCVTSNPVPPSQAVMAICNTYGRVQKPIGFELITLFSHIQGSIGESHSDIGSQCSLWMPIAPTGYSTMGCVAHIGSQPPQNHVVYCLRSDLTASSAFSECIFSDFPSSSSRFSIWRLDNLIGSFYAHASVKCPPLETCCDLSHCLFWNSIHSHSHNKTATGFMGSVGGGGGDSGCLHTAKAIRNLSERDLESLVPNGTNYCTWTPKFERIWWDKGGDDRHPVSIWRPIPFAGFATLGDCITEGIEPPASVVTFKIDAPGGYSNPVRFTKVDVVMGKGFGDVFFWYPVAPPGHVSFGCVATKTDEAPRTDSICCPRMDLVVQANILEVPILRSSSSKADHCWSIWKVENQASTFLTGSDLKRPSSRLAFTLGDPLKLKSCENVSTEIKLPCLSVTILDSFCGMVTPIFDATVTNIKFVTQGRGEAMNGVLISSIAASTFNRQLEAWEPFVEPFDGIFKFESYDTSVHPPAKHAKRVCISATSIVNINVTATNLEIFIETILSWKKLLELDAKAKRLNQEAHAHHKTDESSDYFALNEDDFQALIIENELGCDVYLKKDDDGTDEFDQLRHGDSISLWVPALIFSDRLRGPDRSGETRRYVAIQIVEAQGLPMADDGCSHNFFCSSRIVVDAPSADKQNLFPQSARTRCAKPCLATDDEVTCCIARWNEIFVFEIPVEEPAKLEVEVTNLAANAGKGEVIGAVSLPVEAKPFALKTVAPEKMLHGHPRDVSATMVHPLRKRQPQCESAEEEHERGSLLFSATYFERNMPNDKELKESCNRDVGFWVRLDPDCPWENIRSLLPQAVVPKPLHADFFAMDIIHNNGKKHALLRSLVTVVNDSDVKLDVLLSQSSPGREAALEEIFENNGRSPCSQSNVDNDEFIAINAGSLAILPWRSTSSKCSDQYLQLRPSADLPDIPFSWGQAVAVCCPSNKDGKEQPSIGRSLSGLMADSASMKAFRLSQLEKKDVLFSCSRSPRGSGSGSFNGRSQCWLSVGSDASVLHSELNVPVCDWTISVNSPLKLENQLPGSAKFSISEKAADGSYVERQRGVIFSKQEVHVYSANVNKPVFLSMVVEGDWFLEKDPILVLDLATGDHLSSFWMCHQLNKRRLRVNIERDMGGTTCAPKKIRFFVPYWIVNDSSLPLEYQVVVVEALDSVEADPASLPKAVKSSKLMVKNPRNSLERKRSSSKRVVQALDIIEDTSPLPTMFSLQEPPSRSGVMPFASQKDASLFPVLGLAVGICHSKIYSPGISLLELEKKESVDVKALSSDGFYYNLSAILKTSNRTKVVHFQPQSLFINRLGVTLYLQQCYSSVVESIQPFDSPKHLRWQSTKDEQLKLRIDDYDWSTPFSVCNEGMMRVSLKSSAGSDHLQVRIQVRTGSEKSRREVLFRPSSLSSPYRIENRSMFLSIRYRQVDGSHNSWKLLLPNSAASFFWDDLGRRLLMEVLVDGMDSSESLTLNIDEICDHKLVHATTGATRALCVTVSKEDKTSVLEISDWLPENDTSKPLSQLSGNDTRQPLPSFADSEFHITIELDDLGISIVDHMPKEILYVSVQNLSLGYSTGLGHGFRRFKLRMQGIQVDNQLPLTPMPVLLRAQKIGKETDSILKFLLTMQSNGSLDLCVYPYIGFSALENSAFLVSIHEPIIWRLHELIQQLNFSRLSDSQKIAVSIVPVIQIGVLNISEVRFKVSIVMSPSQRPRGVLGIWSSLLTALGNTENMPVRLNQRHRENVCMKQSALISIAVSNIKKDLLGQPLQLLSGVDILGNASSALGHMSKGVAALSMDKKFIQSRQKQENKGVEDLGDVIREGGGALAKGLFRGVTGILTKPLEGAKSSGIEGFVQGVGKGIIGAAAQPVSGVLDLLSKTTEGANAMRMKIASAITSEEQLLRKRLPRVISGDNLLRPYNEYKAQGQVILQLAESGSIFGQVELFKTRGKFALTDSYEGHFILPKGRIVLVTHKRVILLQQPSNAIAQRKFNPARDPCSVLWDVAWGDLVTMELMKAKKEEAKAPYSRLIIYFRSKPDVKEQAHVIKCRGDTNQAFELYCSIEKAMSAYGKHVSKEIMKNRVMKPYSPNREHQNLDECTIEELSMFSQQMPASIAASSTFGSSSSSSR